MKRSNKNSKNESKLEDIDNTTSVSSENSDKESLESEENLDTNEIKVVSSDSNKVPRKQEKQKKKKKKSKVLVKLLPAKIFFAVGALLLVLVLTLVVSILVRRPGSFLGLFRGEVTQSEFVSAAFFSSITSDQVKALNPRTSFNSNEPIMFGFEYKHTNNINDQLTWKLTKKGSNVVIRSAVFPMYTNDVKNNNDLITRYIPVVSTDETKLEKGEYVLSVYDSESDIIVRHFKVV